MCKIRGGDLPHQTPPLLILNPTTRRTFLTHLTNNLLTPKTTNMNTSDFLIAAAIAGAFVLVAVLVSLSPKTKTTVPTKKLIRKTN